MKRQVNMNDINTVTSYVVSDDILNAWDFQDDCGAVGPNAEILTVAVIAAKYSQNHHEQAMCILRCLGYVNGWVERVPVQSTIA